MLQFHADKFMKAMNLVQKVEMLASGGLDGSTGKFVAGRLKELRAQLDAMGLTASAQKAEELAFIFDGATVDLTNAGVQGLIKQHCNELPSRIEDEIGKTTLFCIDRYAGYMTDAQHFGAEFATRFPSAGYEVAEAAKCLALSRSTACVFHLMRTTEVGIRAVARCLSIPDPTKPAEKNWGEILKAMKSGLDSRWPTASQKMGGDGQFIESVYVSLGGIKNPLRNATMHVDAVYTEEEAETIFILVRGFMKKIASRMDENGEPKA